MLNETLHADQIAPSEIAARLKFEAAYSEVLAAKAETYAMRDDDSDEESDRRFERLSVAEEAFLATPAQSLLAMFMRLEIVEGIVTREVSAGPFTHPLSLRALAALRTDFIAAGITI